MFSDQNGEFNSQIKTDRLPSLLALRCFEAAARREHFSQAAEELHLTHGAVSRAVRLLEDELGVALFERRGRRVFLTEAGRTLAQAVSQGMGLMRQAVAEVRASAQQQQRWVLSCEPTLLMRWLIPRWPDFQARHPGVQVHLVAGGGPVDFASGIDWAIRRNDFAWPQSWHAEPLFAEQVGPVCRSDQVDKWFTQAPTITVCPTAAPLLHARTRPDAWQAWGKAAAQPVPQTQGQMLEHFYFSLQAAVAGLGVAIGSWHMVRDDVRQGVLAAPLGFVEDGSQYCLLSPQAPQASSLQSDLQAWLKAAHQA